MKSLKGIIFALISSGTFGLIPLFALPILKEGTLGLTSILFYRFFFSAILMGIICLFQKRNMIIDVKNFKSIFFFSFLYAATALSLTFAYSLIPSGVATTIHFLYPVFVSLLMITFFKEKKSIVLFIAAIISLVGVGMLCWNGAGALDILGVVVALSTVVTYGLYIVGINQSDAGKINAEVLTFYILLCGAVLFCLIALFDNGIQAIPPDFNTWFRLILLAFLPTVVSDLTLILAIKHAGSTVTSILGSMEPLVSVLIGVYYFHEHFDFYMLIGFLLIILSVFLIIFFSKKSEPKTNQLQ